MNKITQNTKNIISESLCISNDFNVNDTLIIDLDADDLDFVDIVSELEGEFKIKISDDLFFKKDIKTNELIPDCNLTTSNIINYITNELTKA